MLCQQQNRRDRMRRAEPHEQRPDPTLEQSLALLEYAWRRRHAANTVLQRAKGEGATARELAPYFAAMAVETAGFSEAYAYARQLHGPEIVEGLLAGLAATGGGGVA